MSFAAPLVLIGLLAVPLLIAWYLREHRRRVNVARSFVAEPLRASVAPHSPRWRRHAPMLFFVVAIAVLILAAARPQRSVAVPVSDGAVMLVDDVSSSMAATDVAPSRLRAGQRAAERFLSDVPNPVRVGLITFSNTPLLLQSPTTNRLAVRSALTQLHAGGHTAVGDAITRATSVLTSLRGPGGKRIPGAVLLLSDGTSTAGADALTAARQAATQHIPVYTVALGTQHGTIQVGKRTVPVPLSAQQLEQIATTSGGRAYTAADTGKLTAVYSHLAAQFGHKRVQREVTSGFAAAGLGLALVGGALSLAWFGRLV
jgi:Ca-activated chloride channel family protein